MKTKSLLRLFFLAVLSCAASGWSYCEGLCSCSSDDLPATYMAGKVISGIGTVRAVSFVGNQHSYFDQVYQYALIAAAEACEGYPRFYLDSVDLHEFEYGKRWNPVHLMVECVPTPRDTDYYSPEMKKWRRSFDRAPYMEARERVIAYDREVQEKCEEDQKKSAWTLLGIMTGLALIVLLGYAISES